MSSETSGGSTARDQIVQYLSAHPGWHEVSEIAIAIDYTHGHTLKTCKRLAEAGEIDGRKNHQKPVIGYSIHGELYVPGGNRDELIRLIRTFGDGAPPDFSEMSVSDLLDYLRYNVADAVVHLGFKWEFRKP